MSLYWTVKLIVWVSTVPRNRLSPGGCCFCIDGSFYQRERALRSPEGRDKGTVLPFHLVSGVTLDLPARAASRYA